MSRVVRRSVRNWLSSERTLSFAIYSFAILVATAVGLSAWALITGYAISGRVTRIERPTQMQVEKGVNRVIHSLTIEQRRELLDELIASATDSQLRQLAHRIRDAERRALGGNTPSRGQRSGGRGSGDGHRTR